MRTLIALIFGLAVTSAAAFDGQKAASVYNDFRAACRQGELGEKTLSLEEIEQYCVAIDALGFQLKSNGFCWDQSEQEWRACAK